MTDATEGMSGAPKPSPEAGAPARQNGFGFDRQGVDPKEVSWFHRGSDVDQGEDAQHHTLGRNRGQAAPGAAFADLEKSIAEFIAAYGSGLAFARANRVRNADFRVNQRGYVSGAALPPQQYGPDGWCASGLVNRAINPSAETNVTGWGVFQAALTRSTAWADSGAASFQLAASGADSFFGTEASTLGLVNSKTYTVVAVARLTGALSGAVTAGRERRIWVSDAGPIYTSPQIANVAGTQRLAVSFTIGASSPLNSVLIRFYAGHAAGTIWWDSIMILEGDWTSNLPTYFDGSTSGGSWTGPAHASTSYNIAAVGSVTLPTSPNGGLVTLSSGMRMFQAIERADMPAGDWMLSWSGTASARAYRAGTAAGSRPAFTAPVSGTGSFAVSSDGSDDWVVEVEATGGARTFGRASLTPGSVAQPFIPRLMADEVALCSRYYVRWTASTTSERFAFGFQATTGQGEAAAYLPAVPRVAPTVGVNACFWTDGVAFSSAVTGFAATLYNKSAGNKVGIGVTFSPAAGAARYPGAISAQGAGSYIEFDAELRRFAA